MTSNKKYYLTMDIQVKIWHLPKTEEQAIIFLQNKGLFLKSIAYIKYSNG